MAKGAPAGTDSRLMTQKAAEGCCADIWDTFEKAYEREIERFIVRAGVEEVASVGGVAGGQPSVKVKDLVECRENFRRIWPNVKKTALHRLEKALLKASKKVAHMGDVWSRSKKNLITRTSKGSHPRRKKPGRKARNPHARKHVRTGKRKGWPKGKKRSLPGDSKRLADKRRKRRGLAARLIRRYKWSRELKRHWKAYPRKRDKAG